MPAVPARLVVLFKAQAQCLEGVHTPRTSQENIYTRARVGVVHVVYSMVFSMLVSMGCRDRVHHQRDGWYAFVAATGAMDILLVVQRPAPCGGL